MRKLGLGLGINRGKAAPTSMAVNTVAPTLTAASYVAGQIATIGEGTWTGAVSYQYRVLRDGDVVDGRTASTFTIGEEDEATDLVAQVRANDALGIWSGWVSSSPRAIPAVGPSAFTAGMWTLTDPSSDAGDQLTVTISSLPDAGTGPITDLRFAYDTGSGYGTPATIGGTTVGAYTITVSPAVTLTSVRLYVVTPHGTSAAGDVKSATPTSPFANVAPSVTNADFDTAQSPNVLSFDVDEGGTLYYATNGSATALDGGDIAALVVAATPDLYGEAAVDAGPNTILIDPTNLAVGTYYLHMTVKDSGGLYSTDDVVTIVVSAPAISSSSPADNATDVAINVSPTVTFNGPIEFGTGNIVLRQNNGGWSDLETFDVATEQGTGNGQVSISGSVLTINPTSDLANGREHAIRIASTAIDDIFGNSFAGVADDTTLSFTTVAAAAAPTYQSVGAFTAASANISPPNGTHQANDIILVFGSWRSNDTDPTTPSGGWAAVTTPFSGGSTSSYRDLGCWWIRAASAAEAAATLTYAANHIAGQTLVIRGAVTTGTPFTLLGTGTGGGTTVTCPGGATGGDNRLIVNAFSLARDAATSDLSSWSNADLTGLTGRIASNTDLNAGSGIYAATGVRAASATIAATTATLTTGGTWSALSLAFIPA